MQTAQQELNERMVEAAPSKTIPGLVALRNFIGSTADHRRRVNDDHEAGMSLLGFKTQRPAEDDMGDISVSGDHTSTHQHTYEAQKEKSLLPLLASALAAGGLTWAALNY
ncbi:unnamed protein product, partial [marine sediment metagenome]